MSVCLRGSEREALKESGRARAKSVKPAIYAQKSENIAQTDMSKFSGRHSA